MQQPTLQSAALSSATPAPLRLVILAIRHVLVVIPLVAPTLFKAAPDVLRTMLDSGILPASVVAVALSVFFNPGELAADGHAAPMVIAGHA